MNILLIDADGIYPNLALMKLSTYHKQQGDHVDLIRGIHTTRPIFDYDRVFISVIFTKNLHTTLDYASQFDIDTVHIGGSGFDLSTTLDDDVEHLMPDYSLYNIDYSMGFTSRGCIRNCAFCIVPHKEGNIKDHSKIQEFHHPSHKKIMLLDNNFQASPYWKNNITYIINNKLKVNFNQGLDIRLINDEFCEFLRDTNYRTPNFRTRGINFAFDDVSYNHAVEEGIITLENNNIPPNHLQFYILVGFKSTLDDDLYRVNMIKDLGAKPYIMRYHTNDPQLNRLARWVNRMYYQFIEWEDYQ